MRYTVLSPDNIPIEQKTYRTVEIAKKAAARWAKRFKIQGYYRTASALTITCDQLLSHCRIVDNNTSESQPAG